MTTPVDGMTVALDGVAVGRAEWGVAVPVDPGDHAVEASAPHFKPWSTKASVGKEAATTTVTVPALEAAPDAAPEPTPAPPPAPVAPAAAPPATDEGSRGSAQRMVGLIVGAVGVVGLGIGGAFAISAKSTYNSSLSDCLTNAPDECSQAGVNQRNSARSAGDVATVAVAVGAVAVAGGVVLWLTAPPKSSARLTQAASLALVPLVGDGLGGGMLRGTW